MDKLLKETYEYVKEVLKDDYSGHDIDHITRVYNIGCDILEHATCNELVVKLALLLHDIDDYKITKVKTDDCIKARAFLNSKDLKKEDVDHICSIINNMSYSKNVVEKKELSFEGMIVQDADRIDALGAVGIARTFAYGGQNNRSMNNSYEHFDDKLLKLFDLLNTKEAKIIAEERNEFLISFYNQFAKETKNVNMLD